MMNQDHVDIRPLCNRVVVNDTGLALPPEAACLRFGIVARVILQRHDGWKLGAPPELEDVAWTMWPDQWELFARWPLYSSLPMQFYGREAEMTERMMARCNVEDKQVHLLEGTAAACGGLHGHPAEWGPEHTWVRIDRAWRISCERCREIAMQRLAGRTT